jgi:predicted kinase
MPIPEQASRQIMSDLRQRLVELVRADAHVVLDLSFWSRRMREEWREFLAPLGVVPEVIYVRVDRETALSRIRARAATHADDFTLPEHVAELYVDHFEVPSEQEGPLLVVDGKG